MRLSKFTALVAALMLTASTGAIAQSAPTASGSVTRAGAEAEDSSELRGTTAWILAAVVLGLIVWGVVELTGNEEDFPTSP